jgi:hypothetical protein
VAKKKKADPSILGGRRRVLVQPDTFLEDLKSLVSRYDHATKLFEDEFWRLLEFDADPGAVGWIESEIDADFLRKRLGFDFTAFCEMYDDDLEKYVKQQLADDPDEYLGSVDCAKAVNFVVLSRGGNVRMKNQLTDAELWNRVKDRVVNEFKDAVKKEIEENADFYLPLGGV